MEIHPPCHTKILSISLARINQCSEPTHSETTVQNGPKELLPWAFPNLMTMWSFLQQAQMWSCMASERHISKSGFKSTATATYLEFNKKRVFSSKQPPQKKKKNTSWESPNQKVSKVQTTSLLCDLQSLGCSPQGQAEQGKKLPTVQLDQCWIIGGNPDIWMKFH